MRAALRILRAVAPSVLLLCLVLLLLIQLQNHLLRHRAERLLADFEAIRLHQSTWADARSLIHRWSAQAQSEGPCTAADCVYVITLTGPIAPLYRDRRSWLAHRNLPRLERAYALLGGRSAMFRVHFIVQDATIRRAGVWFRLDAHPTRFRPEASDDALMLSANASDSLRPTPAGPWILGSEAQLTQHPDYKVGHPSDCEGCSAAGVTYTPSLPAAELRQLTAYDLSCLTRLHPCRQLPDVFPIARTWASSENRTLTFARCGVPIAARARDAPSVLVVQALSAVSLRNTADPNPDAPRIRFTRLSVLRALKGPIAEQSVLNAYSTASRFDPNLPYLDQPPEELVPGSRYLIFPDTAETTPAAATTPAISLNFCRVAENTPANLQQALQGIEQNDHLRRREPFGTRFW